MNGIIAPAPALDRRPEMTTANGAPPERQILFGRHDLLLLDPARADFESECASDSAAAVQWIAAGRPVIARRPGLARGGESVHCGFPLPPDRGKRRVCLAAPTSSIVRRFRLPGLRECVPHLAQPRRGQAAGLLESCREEGLAPEVFGSLAWQHLTGLGYLRESSDIDLRFKVKDNRGLERVAAVLRRCGTLCHSLFDVEIELWNGRSFSWREFMAGSGDMMVKTIHDVCLVKKEAVREWISGDCRASPAMIAFEAESALCEELETYPKPGLVSRVDDGSHKDMNAGHFKAGIAALRGFFVCVAEAAMRGAGLDELRRLGLAAERGMLAATGGVNTHRGAIFTLGLLAAAAGRMSAAGPRAQGPERWAAAETATMPGRLGDFVRSAWGREIMSGIDDAASHGAEAARRYGCGGARAEAAAGFPSIYQCALPAYRAALERHGRAPARVHCVFALLERVGDTTLLHRSGLEGQEFARNAAREFNRRGGVDAPGWEERAVKTHREFVKRNLTCGGVADLLAATIFIQRVEESCRAWE